MKVVYFLEEDKSINLDEESNTFLEALYKDYASRPYGQKQTFLCPYCKKARYSLARRKWGKNQYTFYFSNRYKESHAEDCEALPDTSIKSFQKNKRLSNIDVMKERREYIIDITRAQGMLYEAPRQRNYKRDTEPNANTKPRLYVKQTYRTFDEVFHFWYVNVRRFVTEGTTDSVGESYLKLKVKAIDSNNNPVILRVKELFLTPNEAHEFYSSDKPDNRKESRFIYAKIIKIKKNFKRKFVVIDLVPIGTEYHIADKYTKLYLSSEQYNSISPYIKPFRSIFFYGKPAEVNKQYPHTLLFFLDSDDSITPVSPYLTDSGDFVDSYPELVISNYFNRHDIKYIKPGRREGLYEEYNLERCKKEFCNRDGNWFVPDWIIFDKDGKPTIVEYYGYGEDESVDFIREYREVKKAKEEFYKSMASYKYIGLDIEDFKKRNLVVNNKIDFKNGKTFKYLDSIFKNYKLSNI